MMRLCRDCDHHGAMKDTLTGEKHSICLLRSTSYTDPVNGVQRFNRPASALCVEERVDSTGFFGFFVDKERCGVDAVNFINMEEAESE